MAELTVEMMNTLDQLEAAYQALSDGYEDFDTNDRFESANQREQMAEALKVALMNWVRAKNRILGESAATVAALGAAAVKALKEIEEALEDLQNLKKTLNMITKAVTTVSGVVATLT